MDWDDLIVEYVEWTDHVSLDDWTDLDQIKNEKPHTISSVGFIIKDDKEHITLGLNLDRMEDKGSCCMVIEKKNITHREELCRVQMK